MNPPNATVDSVSLTRSATGPGGAGNRQVRHSQRPRRSNAAAAANTMKML
jgi:hypothetical protein